MRYEYTTYNIPDEMDPHVWVECEIHKDYLAAIYKVARGICYTVDFIKFARVRFGHTDYKVRATLESMERWNLIGFQVKGAKRFLYLRGAAVDYFKFKYRWSGVEVVSKNRRTIARLEKAKALLYYSAYQYRKTKRWAGYIARSRTRPDDFCNQQQIPHNDANKAKAKLFFDRADARTFYIWSWSCVGDPKNPSLLKVQCLLYDDADKPEDAFLTLDRWLDNFRDLLYGNDRRPALSLDLTIVCKKNKQAKTKMAAQLISYAGKDKVVDRLKQKFKRRKVPEAQNSDGYDYFRGYLQKIDVETSRIRVLALDNL